MLPEIARPAGHLSRRWVCMARSGSVPSVTGQRHTAGGGTEPRAEGPGERVPAGKQGAGSEQTLWGLGTGSFSKACKGKGTRLTPYVQGGGAGHGQSPVPTWGSCSTQFFCHPLASMLLGWPFVDVIKTHMSGFYVPEVGGHSGQPVWARPGWV